MRPRLNQLALRPPAIILGAMLFPILVRLLLLPWTAVPDPLDLDAFGHLLVADTLASGRMANPPHPMWRHLETLYILQQPAYASIYPIGQGAVIAAGKLLFGHTWAGVLLAVSLMCGAIAWMLLACLPVRWAAVGALIASSAYGLHFDWIDMYWGGAFCAFGGALMFGALCRMREGPRAIQGLLAGCGWSIVALIRPYEAALLAVLLWVAVFYRAWRGGRPFERWLPAASLVLAGQFAGIGLTALHNRSVTGSYVKLPYQLSQQAYGVPQGLTFQPEVPRPALRFHEARQVYLLQWAAREEAARNWHRRVFVILGDVVRFYSGPWFIVCLAMLFPLLRERSVLTAAVVFAAPLLAAVPYPFFFPHYIAAYACIAVYLIVRGLEELWGWKFRGRPWGRIAALVVLAGGVLTGLWVSPSESLLDAQKRIPGMRQRPRIIERLEAAGGRHLVFVRYGPRHSPLEEWVYNGANVDDSSIVWCRSLGEAEDARAAAYFGGRRSWLAHVNGEEAELRPYQPSRALSEPGSVSRFPPKPGSDTTSATAALHSAER